MSKFNLRGKLTLTAHSARNLVVKQLIGEMDPFASFNVGNEKFKTPVANNGHRNPKWEFSAMANLDGDEDALHIKVSNKGNVTDDVICRCDIELPNLDLSGKPQWYSLRDPQEFAKECGEIQLSIAFDGTGLPPGSKALATHQLRCPPAGAAVAPAPSPISPQQYGSPQQQQQYASPPQYQTQGMPQYQSPPPQQQPMPVYQTQQPVYQQPQPVYQGQQPVMYQQQPTFQPAPQVVYQPQPVVIVQQPAPVGVMGSLSMGFNAIGNAMTQGIQQLTASAPQYKGKFAPLGYHALHPDVKAAGMQSIDHYVKYGYGEGRLIQLDNGLRGKFDAAGYHLLHPDVKNAGMDSFVHFSQYGHKENRDVAVIPVGGVGVWDEAGYLSSHPDVKAAGMTAWHHYTNWGKAENRRVTVRGPTGQNWTGTFVPNLYVGLYDDLVRAGVEGWTHYKQYGHNEGRQIVVQF